jgi:FkbM family methyltransferase
MGVIAANYKPSWKKFSKYTTYFKYFTEYIKNGDMKSLGTSLKYVFTHKLAEKDYVAQSQLGRFLIRKGTTDFQFINFAYETDVKKYMLSSINSFDVYIDIGACIGEYCIWLAKLGKKCIAVEPVNFEAIRSNVELNGLKDRVQIFNCGLGSKKERVYFNIPKGVTSSSYMDRNAIKEPNVDIETLDNICSQFNISPSDRILIKLDVEGMETEVIAGGQQFLSSLKNLQLIYEHFENDELNDSQVLGKLGVFKTSDLDEVNRLAIKQ